MAVKIVKTSRDVKYFIKKYWDEGPSIKDHVPPVIETPPSTLLLLEIINHTTTLVQYCTVLYWYPKYCDL